MCVVYVMDDRSNFGVPFFKFKDDNDLKSISTVKKAKWVPHCSKKKNLMCDFRTSAECMVCHGVGNVSSGFQCLDLVDRVCFGAFCPWGFRLFVMSFKQFLKSFTVLQSNCLAVMETATESRAIAMALSLITVSNLVRG